jgi:hypothetical protein
MLFGANVAICFAINRKHINAGWQNVKFINVKTVGSPHNQ